MEFPFQKQKQMKTPLNKSLLSVLLLRYRIKNKLNQTEMAKLLGCTQSQYSVWENGGKPIKLREELIRDIIK